MTFNIDLSDMRRERFGQMGMRAAMAFLLFGVGGALMAPGSAVYDIVALAGGGVAAGGIFALERRRYLESRSRVSLAPERFLDLLTQRHRRAAARPGPASPFVDDGSTCRRAQDAYAGASAAWLRHAERAGGRGTKGREAPDVPR